MRILLRYCWANEMWACASRSTKLSWFFKIGVVPTVEGLGHIDEIIESIYGYLALISEKGVQK